MLLTWQWIHTLFKNRFVSEIKILFDSIRFYFKFYIIMFSDISNTTINILSNSSVASVSIYVLVASWLANFYYIMSAYFGPCVCVFGVLNNLLVLLVMIGGGSSFRKRTSKTARIYYIAFAVSDIGCVLSTSLVNFTGTYRTVVQLNGEDSQILQEVLLL